MNWMDVSIIIIIVINSFMGLNRGLILSLFSIGSYIVAFIAAKLYYPYVSNYIINNTNFIPKVQSFVLNKVETQSGSASSTELMADKNIFEIMHLPKTLEDLFMKSAAMRTYSEGIMDNIHGYVSAIITKVLIDLASIIIIFLIVKLILNLIGRLLDAVATLPVIKQFNGLGGFIFGFFKGLLIVFILTALMVPAASIFSGGFISEGLNNSMLTKYFYDYNIILGMIDQYIGSIGSI